MALNTLTGRFARQPLEFLRQYSINPPADPTARFQRKRTIDINELSLRFFSNRQAIQGQQGLQQRFRSAETAASIAWIELAADPVFSGAVTFDLEFAAPHQAARDYTDVSADFENRIAAADRLPVFYLPWKPDRVVRMSIPPYRIENAADFGDGVTIDPYCPHIFFTAGLTGCSVFVYGDPRHPTVAHVGTTTNTPYGDDSARFWRELLMVERFQRLHHEGVAHEANVDQYMGKTESMESFNQWLKHQPPQFTVEHVIGFGAVFGIRYGALWSFYLQENAAMVRYKVTRVIQQQQRVEKGFMGWSMFDKTITENVTVEQREDKSTTIPLCVRPFFPEGGGEAKFWQTFQKTYR